MPLVRIERRLHVGQRGGHVYRFVDRDERVLHAVPQLDRGADVPERKAPVTGAQAVVVDHPPNAAARRGEKARRRLLARLRRDEQSPVRRWRAAAHHALDEPRMRSREAEQGVACGCACTRPAPQRPQPRTQRQRGAGGRVRS